MVDFIYDFNWCLVKSFLGMVFAISERWLFLKFVLEKWLQGIYGFLMVAALKQNTSISTQWRYFVLPSLSLTLRVYVLHVCRHGGWNVISGSFQVPFQYMFRSLKNTQDKEPSSNTDEVIKIIVASNFITEAARRPAVLKNVLWWQLLLFVHIVTIVGNAETLVASFFGLHFRYDWFTWPDHHSNAV